jgi:hypothetical protein
MKKLFVFNFGISVFLGGNKYRCVCLCFVVGNMCFYAIDFGAHFAVLNNLCCIFHVHAWDRF